jgi:hypothetical protein
VEFIYGGVLIYNILENIFSLYLLGMFPVFCQYHFLLYQTPELYNNNNNNNNNNNKKNIFKNIFSIITKRVNFKRGHANLFPKHDEKRKRKKGRRLRDGIGGE